MVILRVMASAGSLTRRCEARSFRLRVAVSRMDRPYTPGEDSYREYEGVAASCLASTEGAEDLLGEVSVAEAEAMSPTRWYREDS